MAGLKEFLEKLEGDTGLQEKVKAAVDENALLKVITDAGYDVKPEELKKFIESVAKEGALSDDDLDNVAGGYSRTEPDLRKYIDLGTTIDLRKYTDLDTTIDPHKHNDIRDIGTATIKYETHF